MRGIGVRQPASIGGFVRLEQPGTLAPRNKTAFIIAMPASAH